MSTITAPLVLDLIAWVAPAPRPYDAVMDAWRTNCPRLTIWEEAVEAGFVTCATAPDGTLVVTATAAGRAALAARIN